MSLNFVSSSVLSSTDGISHNKETPIENPSNTNSSTNLSSRSGGGGYHAPLYEQLRKNQEEEQEKYDEVTKAMRGTRALDEEDVAHLESVESGRVERDRVVREREREEVEMFRVARMEKEMSTSEIVYDKVLDEESQNKNLTKNNVDQKVKQEDKIKTLANMTPKIVVTKKRKRRDPANVKNNDLSSNKNEKGKIPRIDKNTNSTEKQTRKSQEKIGSNSDSSNGREALGGLLGDYGSDSDSSDSEND